MLTEKLTTRVSLETARHVRILASALGETPSTWIRKLIERELKRLAQAEEIQKKLCYVNQP